MCGARLAPPCRLDAGRGRVAPELHELAENPVSNCLRLIPSSTMAERRKCDILMQDGVTSGVVYPGLVCKLAKYYDFQNIGGTSAGAIAASLTAAAEYARRNGRRMRSMVWRGSQSGLVGLLVVAAVGIGLSHYFEGP